MSNIKRFYLIGFLRNLYLYLPIATLYFLQRGISIEVILFSATFYSLLQFLAEMPTGLFADRYGQKASIILGYIIEAMGILTVILWPTSVGLYVCYALGGLSQAFLSGSEEALIYESAKQEKKKYAKVYSTFLSMQTWGMVMGGLVSALATYVFGASSYVWLMAVTVLSLVISAGLSSLHRAYGARISNPIEGSGMWIALRRSMKLIRENDTVFNLTIGAALTLGAEYYLLSAYQPIFIESHVPPAILGVAFSVGLALSALLMSQMDFFERHVTLDKMILGVTLALSFGYAVIGFSFNPIIVVLSFLLLRSLFEVTSPIVSDYINGHIPSDIRATTLSGISLFSRMASFVQRLLLTAAVAYGGVRFSLMSQAVYLFLGGWITYALFRRCGCIHRIKEGKRG